MTMTQEQAVRPGNLMLDTGSRLLGRDDRLLFFQINTVLACQVG